MPRRVGDIMKKLSRIGDGIIGRSCIDVLVIIMISRLIFRVVRPFLGKSSDLLRIIRILS